MNKQTWLIFEREKHPYHLLRPSILPISTSFSLVTVLIPLTLVLHDVQLPWFCTKLPLHFGVVWLFTNLMMWFVAIVKESAQGHHTRKVQRGLRLGMILFIVSEVMLFVALFWGFFHFSLVPSVAIGAVWPPEGTQKINVWYLPFINTILLLLSGFTVTRAHMRLLANDQSDFGDNLLATIVLGLTFLWIQGIEYRYGIKFSWHGNIYGSIFFITTGFHGLHVTIGILFLGFCWIRHLIASPAVAYIADEVILFKYFRKLNKDNNLSRFGFAPNHHFGFEAAAWYWHFVDVVWLFLFITVYWWGGESADSNNG